MDRLSYLPDELLLRILSFLPTTRDVVPTMVLSKRWKFLWMFVPKLVYIDDYQNIEYARFSRFVERSLFLYQAPVVETLHYKIGKTCGTGDIKEWIKPGDNKRSVRELIIESHETSSGYYQPPLTLPGNFYTVFRMLVALKLSKTILVDSDSSSISFPSLKKLSLKFVRYSHGGLLNRILSSCPVLEDLVVEQSPDDHISVVSVTIPSLKSLFLHNNEGNHASRGFVIDSPSLESFNIFHTSGYCDLENSMTKIVNANLAVNIWHPSKKLASTTSVKRLYLCIPTSTDAYPAGSVFSSLVHLTICTCETEWLNLLMHVLKDSPNLKALILDQCHYLRPTQPRPCWNEPSSVPECLLRSLVTFKWVHYDGATEEKEVAAFILRSASCLKKATIIPSNSNDSDKRDEMIKDLSLILSICSPALQLVFS